MARSSELLGQVALNTTAVTIVDGAAVKSEVYNLYLRNTNSSTERTVTLYAHGTTTANEIWKQTLAADETILFTKEELAIIIPFGNQLSGKQDVGTDVIATAYGIEVI